MHQFLRIFIWILLPALHFHYWLEVSRKHSAEAEQSEHLDASHEGIAGDFESSFLLKLDYMSDFLGNIVRNSHEESNKYGLSRLKKKCRTVSAGQASIHNYISRRLLENTDPIVSDKEKNDEIEQDGGDDGDD